MMPGHTSSPIPEHTFHNIFNFKGIEKESFMMHAFMFHKYHKTLSEINGLIS